MKAADEFAVFFATHQKLEHIAQDMGLAHVSPDHWALLNHIAGTWHEGRACSVRQLMSDSSYGSPATIHKRIHQLVALELVTLEAQAADSRKRIVVPGKLAMTYFIAVAKTLRKTAAR
jgi:hypothetical protein